MRLRELSVFFCFLAAFSPYAVFAGPAGSGQEAPVMRTIEKTVTVDAAVAEVWRAWTTVAGVETFFAPEARLALELEGAYEMLFDLEAKPGSQGSEGCKVLSWLPERMLSFSWNAPTHFPELRKEHTFVVVLLQPLGEKQTKVSIIHQGWKPGEQWDQLFAYFERAWDIVLGRLAHRFSKGPIDWSAPFTPGR